jgi:uncharacterized cupin superfamily protein
MSDRHPNVVNETDLPWTELGHGEKFGVRNRRLGTAAGGQRLGCSLYEQPPGKCAFPYHAHFHNEEAVYVLEGEGIMRIGDKEVALRAGDYVALPPGDGHAHQIINRSDKTLRYLAISTLNEPEIVKYPDSNKIAMVMGKAPNPVTRVILAVTPSVDYWQGEE